ncbi:ATP-binding protein [Tepidicaulis sp. LMO-SS28]|uniref:PAS domain-containing sensor histidine kinase n=1 Tax=Tepidicaulis sp. LMO-SS28 TaxID=3447455 RepID=UPI003EE1B211
MIFGTRAKSAAGSLRAGLGALAFAGAYFAASGAEAQEGPDLLSGWADNLAPLLQDLGVAPALASDPSYVAGLLVALTAVILANLFALWGVRTVRAARRLDAQRQEDYESLMIRVNAAEAILAAEPDAVFIWTPETMKAAPGTLQARARIVGSTSAIVDPSSGAVDFDYFVSRLEGEHGVNLREAVNRLRSRGARFSLTLQTLQGRIFEAEGRPAGAQAVLWLRDVTGERAEVSRLIERAKTAETARARLAEQVDCVPLPIWRRSEEGMLLWANAAYVRAVEAPDLDHVLERQIHLSPDDMRRTLGQKLAAGEPANGTAHAVIGGERRALDVTEFLLEGGQIAGVAVDVTALERLEQELRRHIEAHRTTLDRLTTAVAIFGPDKRLKFHNEAYEKLWGLDDAFLKEGPSDGEVLDQLRAARRLPEQANYQDWKAKRLDLYRSSEPLEEYWHLPDGQTVRVMGQAHPFGGLIYVYENVTEKLHLESSYNVLEHVQRETLDNLKEAVAVFGTDGRLKLHNPAYAQIWNFKPEQLEGEPHFNELAEASAYLYDNEPVWTDLRARITAAGAVRAEHDGRINRPDGAVIDYALVPLPDGATLLTFVDMTDSTRMERALRERNEALETADRLKSEFISHVSYQLRTPLTNIIGFGEILEAEMFGELTSKQHEYTVGILDSSNQLLDLVNDILDLATVEAGAMALEVSEVEIAEVLNAAEEFAQRPAQKAKINLAVECPPDIGVIKADERRIKQIMLNLLSNALSFTQAGDAITIGAARTENEVALYVTDTGDGIKPEHQATVFDRFEARGAPDRQGGAGLGLALVKSFVELHGGWVTLESEPGIGTRVTCHLPLHAAQMRTGPALRAGE